MKVLGCVVALTQLVMSASPLLGEEALTHEETGENISEEAFPSEEENLAAKLEPAEKRDDIIHTLIISGADQKTEEMDEDKKPGLYVYGICIPGGERKFDKAISPYYLGVPVNQEMLETLKRQIILYYQDNDRPVVLVKIPPQTIKDGVLHVIVTEATIDQITFCGNEWFRDKQLRSYIDFEPGDTIRRDILTKDLEIMNRNPFRRTDVVFSPGSKPATTNLEFMTKDQMPIRFYAGTDNTGFRPTRYNRWYGGINIGNLFYVDHLIDYQYMAGPSGHDFFSHTLKYSAPLPTRDYLVVYGGYSKVHFKNGSLRTLGKTAQISGRYEIPFFPRSELLQELTFGFDYKFTENNLFQTAGTPGPLFQGIVNLTEFMAGYNLGWERSFYKSSFTIEGFLSPGGFISHQSSADYNALREHAKPTFFYLRAALAPIFRLPKNWTVQLTLRGQVATNTLIQSEQYSMGGYDTVRGYLEREVAGDDAFVGNLELRTPSTPILGRFSKKIPRDSFLLLGFIDYGAVYNIHNIGFEKQTASLLGIGPGARYNMGSYVTARLDWGFQLLKTGVNPFFSNRVHFAAIVAY